MDSQGLSLGTYVVMAAQMDRGKACSGISRSHKECVKIAKEKHSPYVIIIEDDIMFLHKEALLKFQKFHNELPENWDLFLGGMYDGTPVPISENVARVKDKISGLHLYMVNRNFYDKFLQADEAANLDYWVSVEANANIYVAYPFLALQYEFYSDNSKSVLNYNYDIGKRYKLINEILK